MIRIGDFSKLSLVSVKAVRYYDDLGLLKPVQTDPFTGYRMYEYHQLLRLNRVLALKNRAFRSTRSANCRCLASRRV